MLKTWNTKPYQPFFIISLLSLAIAFAYRHFSPESYFDLSIKEYLSLSNFKIWLIFSGYTLLLSGIYFIARRNHMHTSIWLVRSHFIFILLFLLFFFTFSLFNTVFVHRLIEDMPFFVLFGIYGTIFLIDAILFVAGLILLFYNLITMKKD